MLPLKDIPREVPLTIPPLETFNLKAPFNEDPLTLSLKEAELTLATFDPSPTLATSPTATLSTPTKAELKTESQTLASSPSPGELIIENKLAEKEPKTNSPTKAITQKSAAKQTAKTSKSKAGPKATSRKWLGKKSGLNPTPKTITPKGGVPKLDAKKPKSPGAFKTTTLKPTAIASKTHPRFIATTSLSTKEKTKSEEEEPMAISAALETPILSTEDVAKSEEEELEGFFAERKASLTSTEEIAKSEEEEPRPISANIKAPLLSAKEKAKSEKEDPMALLASIKPPLLSAEEKAKSQKKAELEARFEALANPILSTVEIAKSEVEELKDLFVFFSTPLRALDEAKDAKSEEEEQKALFKSLFEAIVTPVSGIREKLEPKSVTPASELLSTDEELATLFSTPESVLFSMEGELEGKTVEEELETKTAEEELETTPVTNAAAPNLSSLKGASPNTTW